MTEKNQVAVVEKNITDNVLSRVQELETDGAIHFPKNYSYQNALKSAYLILRETTDKSGKSVLEACTKESIANALLDMVIQGLSPAKKQCYFIPYGSKLTMQRSYFGTQAVLKRVANVKNSFAVPIYEKDEFDYKIDLDTGNKVVTVHNQGFENIDPSKLKGAYAVINFEDGSRYIEVMNMTQIKAAWNQGQTKGNSPAHNNFSDEMAKKSVLNRAAKNFINTSDDSDLLIEAFDRTDDEQRPALGEIARAQIATNANAEALAIDEPEEFETVEQITMEDDDIPEELR